MTTWRAVQLYLQYFTLWHHEGRKNLQNRKKCTNMWRHQIQSRIKIIWSIYSKKNISFLLNYFLLMSNSLTSISISVSSPKADTGEPCTVTWLAGSSDLGSTRDLDRIWTSSSDSDNSSESGSRGCSRFLWGQEEEVMRLMTQISVTVIFKAVITRIHTFELLCSQCILVLLVCGLWKQIIRWRQNTQFDWAFVLCKYHKGHTCWENIKESQRLETAFLKTVTWFSVFFHNTGISLLLRVAESFCTNK